MTAGLDVDWLRDDDDALRGERGDIESAFDESLDDPEGKRRFKLEKLHFLLGLRVAVAEGEDGKGGADAVDVPEGTK